MPLVWNAGFSWGNTPRKQDHFRLIMRTLCKIVQSIMRRWPATVMQTFLYVDLNAGPGWYREGETLFEPGLKGSPLIALDAAREIQMPLQGYFIEHDPDTATALYGNLRNYGGMQLAGTNVPWRFIERDGGPSCADLYVGESATFTPQILDLLRQVKNRRMQEIYGVIYSDPNGGQPPFDELAAFSQTLEKTDILIHLSGAHRKRWQYRRGTHPPLPLIEALKLVKKDFWTIRRPYGQEQWTFLIGTNWDSFPRFEKQYFVRTDSHEGRKILAQLSYRREDFL